MTTPSKLAIFDIDGTLTQTNEIDHICFIQTVQKFITKEFKTFEAEAFTHFTDSCIIIELYERYLKRQPTVTEEQDFKTYYFDALKQQQQENPHYFKAIDGAAQILSTLKEQNWALALATGCWLESAHIKLEGGKVDIQTAPLATASDAITRQDIMLTAIQRAKKQHQIKDFEHIVYIGDGLWDKHSCASINLPFVGIDANNTAYGTGKLKAFHLLADYKDTERVEQLLLSATTPSEER